MVLTVHADSSDPRLLFAGLLFTISTHKKKTFHEQYSGHFTENALKSVSDHTWLDVVEEHVITRTKNGRDPTK